MLATPGVVDLVLKEKGDRSWKLVLEVNAGEWELPRAVHLLEEKLNAYAGYVLDGMMQEMYPASHPSRTRIVVAAVEPFPDKAVWLLDKVKLALRPHQMELEWDAKGGMPKGGLAKPEGM